MKPTCSRAGATRPPRMATALVALLPLVAGTAELKFTYGQRIDIGNHTFYVRK
jgi:hypothetical protein